MRPGDHVDRYKASETGFDDGFHGCIPPKCNPRIHLSVASRRDSVLTQGQFGKILLTRQSVLGCAEQFTAEAVRCQKAGAVELSLAPTAL